MAYGYNAPFMMSNYQRGMQPQPMVQMPPQQMPMQMPDNQQFVPNYPQPMQPIPQSTNDMLWVLNENEATSYPVAPNNSVVLWDKSNPTIYVKSVNAQGVPSMRILDFNERTTENAPKTSVEHKCDCSGKFVPKEDFKALEDKFEALQKDFDDFKAKPKTKAIKKIYEEEE
jgi:hypothetical protein